MKTLAGYPGMPASWTDLSFGLSPCTTIFSSQGETEPLYWLLAKIMSPCCWSRYVGSMKTKNGQSCEQKLSTYGGFSNMTASWTDKTSLQCNMVPNVPSVPSQTLTVAAQLADLQYECCSDGETVCSIGMASVFCQKEADFRGSSTASDGSTCWQRMDWFEGLPGMPTGKAASWRKVARDGECTSVSDLSALLHAESTHCCRGWPGTAMSATKTKTVCDMKGNFCKDESRFSEHCLSRLFFYARVSSRNACFLVECYHTTMCLHQCHQCISRQWHVLSSICRPCLGREVLLRRHRRHRL